MRLPGSASHRVLTAAFVILLLRMTLALTIIPPWQQPDEPIHVAVAEVWRNRFAGSGDTDRGREAEIIHSMIRNAWWLHYGKPLPSGPEPTRFVATGVVAEGIGLEPESAVYPSPYYATVGWLLSLGPLLPVEVDLTLMRGLSMALALGTLAIAFFSSRLALGDLAAMAVTSLLALQPQFVIASTTAGPDALVVFAGAIVWWQSVAALRGAQTVGSLAILWAAALSAALIDRLGVALIPVAVATSSFVSVRRMQRHRAFATVGIAVFAIGLAIVVFRPLRSSLLLSLGDHLMPAIENRREFAERFATSLFASWWYSLGWARYFAPAPAIGVAAVVTAIAGLGLGRRLLADGPAARDTIIVSLTSVLGFLGAVYWVFFRFGVGAQGRHLFPAMVPTLVLLWLGVSAWMPERFARQSAVALVLVFALLDVCTWTLVAFPVYL